MNGRFFPNNWRPASEEIRFAQEVGFQALQFQGKEAGLTEAHLGEAFSAVAKALQAAKLTATMEILIRLRADGRTQAGASPLEVLGVNLPAIQALSCRHVHLHLVLDEPAPEAARQLERALAPDFSRATLLAKRRGFRLGLEHSEPEQLLFGRPEGLRALLEAVPDLGFVWDFNHTVPEHVPGFKALISRTIALHVSDTPLPEVNHHLPLGLGRVDFVDYARALFRGGFRGPAILEIGGLPKSGGFGRDTDDALVDSREKLRRAFATAAS